MPPSSGRAGTAPCGPAGGAAPRVLRTAAALFAIAWGIGTPVGGGAQEPARVQPGGDRIEVEEIVFRGNDHFPSDSLERAIVNRETTCRNFFFKFPLPFCPLGFDFADDRHYFFPGELDRDARRLEIYYFQRGFREAAVDTSTTRLEPDAIRIDFVIDEGRPVLVDTVHFLGDSVPDPDLYRDLPIEEGDPLSAILMDATRDTLRARLRDSGYAHADVLRNLFIPNETPYRAELEYDIYSGPQARFGEIEVRWSHEDHALSEQSVLRFLPFEPGDVYSRRQVLDAQRTLFGVDLISSARIDEHLDNQPDSLVPLTVTVSEGRVHRVRAGVGLSTADCVNAETSWTSRNFMGGARRLTLRGRLSNVLAHTFQDTACPQSGEGEFADLNGLLSAELLQPWIFSSRNSLTASVYVERASLPDVFVRRAVGASVGLTRSLDRGTPASLSYRPQLSTLSAAEIFFCTSFLVCTPEDIDLLQSANWLAPAGLTVTRDRSDDLLNPSRGYQATLDLEHASSLTGSNFAYNRAVLEGRWYEELAWRNVLAARIRGGWIGSGEFIGIETGEGIRVIHPQKRFYAGGANSVRGFPQNRLGPRVLTTDVRNLLGYVDDDALVRVCEPLEVLDGSCDAAALGENDFFPRPTGGSRVLEGNVEYRFSFARQLQAALFLDFGQVWQEEQPLGFGDIEVSPGLGVRYFSPIGPVRVDLGYRLRGSESLQVVTSQIRPFIEGDDPEERICIDRPSGLADDGAACGEDAIAIPWVRVDQLALLQPEVPFGESGGFFRRLQLHFSIGQAF